MTQGAGISRGEARECWRQICEEAQPDLQQGAFIGALKAKKETPEEVAGTFEALYEHDTIKIQTPEPIIDNCGTGADTLKTFNIRTGAAIAAAACGLYVVRHAARAISSHCGAVDVVETLGVNVESAPELPKQAIEHAGICVWNAFLPAIHPRPLGRALSQVRFGSTMNIVGPLLNPTMPQYKVMGVPSLDMIDIVVRTLRELGFKRAFVMHGLDDGSDRGVDEISTLGPAHIAAEALLDGIYIVRTSVSAAQMDSTQCVRNYKSLANVERAFRSVKTVDLKVRPIHHHTADRVRAHIFLCMLAYYVEWHMREAWRELMFADVDTQAKAVRDPVAPAKRSKAALAKVASHTLDDGTSAHSFSTLMAELSTIVRNTCRTPNAAPDTSTFEVITTPNATQQRALNLIEHIHL